MKRSDNELLQAILSRLEDIDQAILVDDPEEGEIYNYIGGISLENNRELRAINEKLDVLIDILSKTAYEAEFGKPLSRCEVREVIEMDNSGVQSDPMEDNR